MAGSNDTPEKKSDQTDHSDKVKYASSLRGKKKKQRSLLCFMALSEVSDLVNMNRLTIEALKSESWHTVDQREFFLGGYHGKQRLGDHLK